MKIRTGFVSNSSSSSFCIFGVYENLTEDMIDALEDAGFSVYDPFDSSEKYAGMDCHKMEMDETRRQFEDRVTKKLEELGYTGPFSNYQEGWYNG